jgi:hypothetical protein
MKWVRLDGLEKHWERARLNADVLDDHTIQVTTTNVSAFTLDMGPGGSPLDVMIKPAVVVDGQKLVTLPPASDRSWEAHLKRRQAVGLQWIAQMPVCASGPACKVRSMSRSWIAS